MALYICYNCLDENGKTGLPFESDVPVCKCGVDDREPDMKGLVMKRETIHYDAPHKVIKGRGVRKTACKGDPVGQQHLATGEPSAVTCSECKKTEMYKFEATRRGVPALLEAANVVVKMEDDKVVLEPVAAASA